MNTTPTSAATIEPPLPAAIVPSHPYPATARSGGARRPRHLTVSYLPAVWPAYTPRPQPLPYLRLRGRWLQEAGFAVGAQIRVRVEARRLILEVENERVASRAASPSVHEPLASLDMGTHII